MTSINDLQVNKPHVLRAPSPNAVNDPVINPAIRELALGSPYTYLAAEHIERFATLITGAAENVINNLVITENAYRHPLAGEYYANFRTAYRDRSRVIARNETLALGSSFDLDFFAQFGEITRAVRKRLDYLTELSIEEDISVNELSRSDITAAIAEFAIKLTPQVSLLPSGNFRLSWRESAERHAAFEFLGDRRLKFVIFSTREDSPLPVTLAGEDTIAGLPNLLKGSGLAEWVLF